VAGDVLVAGVYGSATPSTPDGWALLAEQTVGPSYDHKYLYLWGIVDTGALGDSVEITITGQATAAVCVAVSGAVQAIPDPLQCGVEGASVATCPIPAIGPWASGNGIDLAWSSEDTDGVAATPADPAGYNRLAAGGPNNWIAICLSYLALSDVADVGALSAAWTNAAGTPKTAGGHIFIKEAAITAVPASQAVVII
jgi:hypothetical protein